MTNHLGLKTEHVIADIGSGTGIFTRMLLENGNRVFAVEPNSEMRLAAGRELSAFGPLFTSIEATAERTTLLDASVDFVTSAQAFHWFDPKHSRREFTRILRPKGYVLLIWNNRKETGSPFFEEYERALARFGVDYETLKHGSAGKRREIDLFFEPNGREIFHCANAQVFDFEGFKGRCLSSSYAPKPGHPKHDPLMRELRTIFDRHQQDGKVVFEYETEVFYGRLEA